jgi:predicted ArsR family transcriptional regulator
MGPVPWGSVTTRSRLLLLLRKHPGATVAELAAAVGLTGMGVRRHLEALEVDGLVERSSCARLGVGRPPTGWRLSPAGMELLPRSYDTFVLQLLEDVCEQVGDDGIDAVMRRRGEKMAGQYREELADAATLEERVAGLAQVRDRAGYVAEWRREGEVLVLVENNCAVHRVAERFPAVCAMELALFRKVLGPAVEVTRVAHTMAGEATCTYRIRPRPTDPPD